MNEDGHVIASLEMEAVAHPAPGMTMEELICELKEAGNEILEVYDDGVLIGYDKTKLTIGGDNGR